MTSPALLQELIASWSHEAAVARASLRQDDYAARCQETAEALRELQQWREFNWSGWQPIETAPENTNVLVYWPGMYFEIPVVANKYSDGPEDQLWAVDGRSWSSSAPTHWMPLPSPPCNERENERYRAEGKHT